MTDTPAAAPTKRVELTVRALILGCLLAVVFTAANTYNIEVTVTDATETTPESDTPALEFTIRNNPLVSLTIDPDQTSNHYVNEEVILQAAVDGGDSPLSYRFYYQLGSAQRVEIKNPKIEDQQGVIPTKKSMLCCLAQ